jgi:hypothetical protein
MFKANDPLIKDPDKLPISPEIKTIIRDLVDRIEYPVVFWLNARTDRNYATTHRENRNQLWVTITPETDPEDIGRVVLTELYFWVMQQKRTVIAQPFYYISGLDLQFLAIDQLANDINSMVLSVESSLYLKQYGIVPTLATKENAIQRVNSLLASGTNNGRQKNYYRDVKTILDTAYCAWRNPGYKHSFEASMLKICPLETAMRYVRMMYQIIEVIESVAAKYQEDTSNERMKQMTENIIIILGLQKIMHVAPYNARRTVASIDGEDFEIYNYVPDDWENALIILQCVRYANECLANLRECHGLDDGPVAEITVSNNPVKNAYAYGNSQCGYGILLTRNLIMAMKECAESNHSILVKAGMEETESQQKLLKYAVFYLTLHEYAHILFHDCDQINDVSDEERDRREHQADEFANLWFPFVVRFQHRQETLAEFENNCVHDHMVEKKAKQLIEDIRRL